MSERYNRRRMIIASTVAWSLLPVTWHQIQKPFKPVKRLEGLHPIYLALNDVNGRERFLRKVSSAPMQGRSSGFPTR
jgi:hypothetical protein